MPESNIKLTGGITFTIHYSDGTSADVKDGVLFASNGRGIMNVHVGVDGKRQLFGVYPSFFELLTKLHMEDDFDEYMTRMTKEIRDARMELRRENEGGAGQEENIVRGIWDE